MKVTLIDREKGRCVFRDDARFLNFNNNFNSRNIVMEWDEERDGVRADVYDFLNFDDLSIIITGVKIDDDQF